MLKIIDRYIIGKFLGTFFYAISLLIVVVIVFDISEKVDEFVENSAPVSAIIFDYYLNFIPYFMNLFSYLFTFIAVIYFTSKMAGRTEIIAILSSGVSFKRLLRPYVLSAMFIGLISFFLANFLIPHTNRGWREFEKVYLKDALINRDRNIHMQTEPGVFTYVESYNNFENVGYKFSREVFDGGILLSKMGADKISWNAETERWTLDNYYIRAIDGMQESLIKGKNLDTIFQLRPEELTVDMEDLKIMDYWQIRAFIEKEKLKGTGNVKAFEIEKYQRMAFPFSAIILTLIGVSLSSRKVRGGIGMHLGFGIAITFSYILFMQVSNVFATFGDLSPLLAVWIPNIVFGVLAIFLIRIAPK